jgi:CRP-like cAMP-binding protein
VAVHSKLWYLEHFKLVDALDERQRRVLEETTRMQEVKRGQRIYQSGDPSEHL